MRTGKETKAVMIHDAQDVLMIELRGKIEYFYAWRWFRGVEMERM